MSRQGRGAPYDAYVVVLLIVLAVVVLLVLFVVVAYNGLVRLRNRIDNASTSSCAAATTSFPTWWRR